MNVKTLALRGAAALAFLIPATVSEAAPAGAGGATTAPVAPTVAFGPPIAGICAVSTNEVLGVSQVGKSVIDRMNMLKGQVATELQPQATALSTEQHALQQTGSPDPTRVAAFNLKASEYQKLHDQRLQELDATQQKAVRRMLLELQPVLQQVFQQKQCSILLEKDNGVLAVNPAMDLTQAAILGLNAKIQSITFDREQLPAQPGAATQQ